MLSVGDGKPELCHHDCNTSKATHKQTAVEVISTKHLFFRLPGYVPMPLERDPDSRP